MSEFSIPANCTCGNPSETSPALHAGKCKVWALHHNLTDEKPIEVVRTSETCIHLGLTTPTAEVDSRKTRARIIKAAMQWADAHDFTGRVAAVGTGATLGPETSETRMIFFLTK